MQLDFSKGRILIVGDLMLDRYHFGTVSRISPEAPVPVVKVTRSSDTLGGAGNVANNGSHLGASVALIGPLGDDENGARVKALCRQRNINLTVIPLGAPTITKTRIIGEHQQIVRIDVEEEFRFSAVNFAFAKKTILEKIKWATIVVLSDYGKGFCCDELCALVIGGAKKQGLPVIVDPKGPRWAKYSGATVITPNVKELSDIALRPIKNDDIAIAAAAGAVRKKFRIDSLLVTRSEKGMSLINNRSVEHFPTHAREVFDVSGAGDTVVATLAASLACGRSLRESALLANKAAGIVVGKIGTAPIELEELRAAIDTQRNPKLFDRQALVKRCDLERGRGKRIVFTNGCFDVLHRGHLHLLLEAKRLGNVLVVALNSDASAVALKAAPINSETDRAHLMAAIDAVDFITIFNEKTPLTLIQAIRPDVIVKGGNYKVKEILGREYAGKAVVIPHLKGYSSEEIARKIGSGKK
jgi:D-beta-D-heptose 7-phosphate kinase / D-beta-D-heptose 1-phosphate adenosyltransferase